MSDTSEDQIWFVTTVGTSWSSDSGFVYDKCEHRMHGACLRCRVGWLIRLWRMGNHVWYLP